MKIKMNEGFRSSGPNGNFGAGDTMTVPDNIGRAMVKAGAGVEVVAEVVEDVAASPDIETADAPPAAEKATRKRKPRKVSGG